MADGELKRRTKEAVSTAVGAGAGQGTYQIAGYQTKHYVDRHTRKGNPGVTSAQVKLQDKVLKPNKAKYGMGRPQSDPLRDNKGYHRNYPKELPYAQHIRTLGHTHEGKTGMAVGAAATAGGAAAGYLAMRHRNGKLAKRNMSAGELRTRRRVQAGLSTTTASIGLGTLAATGVAAVARRKGGASGVKTAMRIKRSIQPALIAGGGIGGVAGFNSAAISRAEANKGHPKTQHIHKNAFGVEVEKGFRSAASEGYRLAGAPKHIRATARAGQAHEPGLRAKSGFRAGVATHDFGRGFSRKMITDEHVKAGSHVTQRSAANPQAFKAGNLTRKVGVPVAVLGGGYATGRAIGRKKK